jgi:hypothetical protein
MPRLPLTNKQNARVFEPAYLMLIQPLIRVRRQHISIVINTLILRQISLLPSIKRAHSFLLLLLGMGFQRSHELHPRPASAVAELPLEIPHIFVVDRRITVAVLEQVEQAYWPLLGWTIGQSGREEVCRRGIQAESPRRSWTLGCCLAAGIRPIYAILRNPSERRAGLSPFARQLMRRRGAQLARSIIRVRVRVSPEVSRALSRDVSFQSVVLVAGNGDSSCDVRGYCVCGQRPGGGESCCCCFAGFGFCFCQEEEMPVVAQKAIYVLVVWLVDPAVRDSGEEDSTLS